MGTDVFHSHRLVPDMGRGHRGSVVPGRACHLAAVLCQEEEFAGRIPRLTGGSPTRAIPRHSLVARTVSLDHGGGDVHAALHRVPSEGWRPIRLGDLPLDRRKRVDGVHFFHIVHASFFLDFWAIWPDKEDISDAVRRVRRFLVNRRRPRDRFAKYPLENKLYHGAIIATGLSAIGTGVFMMFRVRTIFFPRNPYLFSDMTWGLMYVLHGLAGVGLIALVIVHVYFAVRPEKMDITQVDDLRHDEPRVLSESLRSSTVGCRRRASTVGVIRKRLKRHEHRFLRTNQYHRRVLRVHAGSRRRDFRAIKAARRVGKSAIS